MIVEVNKNVFERKKHLSLYKYELDGKILFYASVC